MKKLIFLIFFLCLSICNNVSSAGTAGNKTKKNQDNKNNNKIVLSVKPNDMPDFPKDNETQYQRLFDDTFTNVIEKDFIYGEENDIFIDPKTAKKYNDKYVNGNDDVLTQIDVINAERRTQENGNNIDKDKVNTTRTRVVAYLTLDQMLLDDMFLNQVDAYYIDFVYNKLKEKANNINVLKSEK